MATSLDSLEQSIKSTVQTFTFEPNVPATWVAVESRIENLLMGIWKEGGLAGAKPEEAFSVRIGLGSTMTPNDILDGYMKIMVLVALTRPAEFTEVSVQQQMQKS